METLLSPPRTMMEVFDMLPEGTLAELIDNQLYMAPSPIYDHQDTLGEIYVQLRKFLSGKGVVVMAPFDVKLDPTRNAVQPDLTVILNSNPNQIKEGRYFGTPDFIVEILSPGNKDHDLITKKDLYEKFGVKEYWVIDPETKLALGFSYQDSRLGKFSEMIAKIQSRLLQAEFNF
jgi:Uma2 family endonuclease